MKQQIKPVAATTILQQKFSILSLMNSDDYFPALLILLYAIVEYIPNLGAYDVAGPQWVYLNLINGIGVAYLLRDKKSGFPAAVQAVCSSLLSMAYLAFFLLAGLSIIAATNKVESLCCYTQLATTLLMYGNIALLLYRRMHLFHIIAWIISILLVVQSVLILYKYFEAVHLNKSLDDNLAGIILNAGHKNVLAASMVIKFPFLLYIIYKGKIKERLFTMSIFALAVCSLIILNTRSTYLALLFTMGIYAVYYMREYSKVKSTKIVLLNILGVIALFIIGILLSNALLGHSRIYKSDFYGTFLNKLSSIKWSNEGSDNRFWLWGNALSYIKNNLLLGCGYGNWKLAVIPYEKNTLSELIVSLHVHNDFLETTAETGILGGLLFFSIFLIVGWYILRTYFQKHHFQQKDIAPVLFAILVCYFVDAALNFPGGRPVMQFYFAFLLALAANFYLAGRPQPYQGKIVPIRKPLFATVYLGLLVPAIIVQVMIYQSLVAQQQFSRDSVKQQPSQSFDDVKDAFPVIPNIDVECLPIGEIKAKYLIKEKMYPDALQLLRGCSSINPNLGYNDYLQGIVFFKTGKMDSAYYYASRAFDKRPRATPFGKFLLTVCAIKKDKTTADQVFSKVVALHSDSLIWNHYIEVLSNLGVGNPQLITLTDSALNKFPGDESLKKTKNELMKMAGIDPDKSQSKQ